MEKIRDSITKELPPLRIYIDELHEIYEVLSNHCAESVKIETCGYRLENLGELENLPKEQTHELYISSLKPYLQIRLTQTRGEIYIGNGDLESEGLVSRLEKILVRGKTWLPSLPNNWVNIVLGAPLGIGLFLQDKLLIIIGVSAILLSFLWGWLYYASHIRLYNTIIFKSRRETPSFWTRNKDEIVMLTIGTIIGVVITKLIDVVFK